MGRGLESKKFQRVCQITHLDRIVTEAWLWLRQSSFVLALICLFQIILAERTNVAVWSYTCREVAPEGDAVVGVAML